MPVTAIDRLPFRRLLGPAAVLASLDQTPVEDMPLHTSVITHGDIKKSAAPTLDPLLWTAHGFDFHSRHICRLATHELHGNRLQTSGALLANVDGPLRRR